MDRWAPYARIGLRYIAGYLVAKGLVDAATADVLATDPTLIDLLARNLDLIAGLIAAAASEAWYWLARRLWWAT